MATHTVRTWIEPGQPRGLAAGHWACVGHDGAWHYGHGETERDACVAALNELKALGVTGSATISRAVDDVKGARFNNTKPGWKAKRVRNQAAERSQAPLCKK